MSTLYCKVKHVDNDFKTRVYLDEKGKELFKDKFLSKSEFAVREEVSGTDAEILGHLGVAITKDQFNHISKIKGTLPLIRDKNEK